MRTQSSSRQKIDLHSIFEMKQISLLALLCVIAAIVSPSLQQSEADYNTHGVDGIVSGFVVMAPFVLILFIGICCTYSIQSELKLDTEKAKKQ